MLVDQDFNKLYGNGYLTWLQKSSRRSIVIKNKRFFLSFPNTLFFIRFQNKHRGRNYLLDNLQIFFIGSEKLTLDSPIYGVPLPNLHSEGSVCMQEEDEEDDGIEIYASSKKVLAEKVVTHFWSTIFNDEEFESEWQREYKRNKKLLGNFQRWQAKTLKEPTWIPDEKHLIHSQYVYLNLVNFDC